VVPSSNAAAAVALSTVRRGPECTTDTLAYARNPMQTSNREPSAASVSGQELVTHDVSANDLGLALVLVVGEDGHDFLRKGPVDRHLLAQRVDLERHGRERHLVVAERDA